MEIANRLIYSEASSILKSLYGENARFRDGQYEAIEATLLNRRTLVVQRTGWGKSMVYFTCTKLLRSRGAIRMLHDDAEGMCGDFHRACVLGDCEGLSQARGEGRCLPEKAPSDAAKGKDQ